MASLPTVAEEFQAIRFTQGPGENLGPLVCAGVGDVNDDGIDDFAIGAPQADPAGRIDAGELFVLPGSPTRFRREILFLNQIGGTMPGLVMEGLEPGDQLGHSVSGGFDVNGDGGADLLVGAPFAGLTGGIIILSPVTACGSSNLAPTSCGTGACAATGLLQCVGGSLQDTCTPGIPIAEVCDSIDNDCDGCIDEKVCPSSDKKKHQQDPREVHPKRNIKDDSE